jgi:filamentous hemagglutinin family protein
MSVSMSAPISSVRSWRGGRSLLLATATRMTVRAAAGLGVVAVLAVPADAGGPNGGTVVGGSATISGQGTSSVTINQSSQNAIINWQTFNLGTGDSATFNQLNNSSIALNRVIGGFGPSFIDGTIKANGRVFIVNGDGILFGSNASISTAGFLATTSDIRNADFMHGNYNFNIPGSPSASIVNLGSITASSGGFAALVAPGVRNSGTITATLGTVALAAGNAYTLDFYGDKLITLAVNDQIASAVKDVQSGETLKSLVSNTGKLSANGGRVELTAAAARAVVDSVINNTGVIEANSVGSRNGMIVLSAATGKSKGAGAPTQTVALSGKISAAGQDKGTKGGTVVVSGENIQLASATIDASGDAGGGHVLIGGDTGGGNPSTAAAAIALAKLESFIVPTASTVTIDAASTINVSANGNGNGGKAVVWSNQATTFAGTILAMGGAAGGNGGFVETSSHGTLNFTGATVNTMAPLGKTGTWLLDPTDLVIDQTAATTISNDLATSNVTLTTFASGAPSGPTGTTGNTTSPNNPPQGDIWIETGSGPGITWSSGNTLTLSAYRDINFGVPDPVSAQITSTGAGSLILRADNTGTGSGTVRFNFGGINFSNSTGTVSIYYNPVSTCGSDCNKYLNPNDASYNAHVLLNTDTGPPHQLISYMLVNSAADLTLVGQSANESGVITGNFALGKSFSASPDDGFVGFQNIGTTFAGLFDGNGGLGVNYTISNINITAPNNDGAGNSFGLFPFLTGTVRNLNLANITINAGDNLYFLGTVAGDNSGTISNVQVTSGSVNGLTFTALAAAGLVGQNEPGSLVTGSSANVSVTVGDANNTSALNMAGGLVGSNLGTVSNSSATGNVQGGLFSFVGGLVGQNGLNPCDGCNISGPGSITQSFATGTVATGFVGGGLVGQNNFGNISGSHATGNVSGSGNVTLGGFVGSNQHGSGEGPNTISNSYATGSVTGTSLVRADNGQAKIGGFAGLNNGLITNSYAANIGGVSGSGGTDATVGDFIIGGFVGVNGGTIKGTQPLEGNPGVFTYTTSTVTGGANSVAGGFAGESSGSITFAYASGNVKVGSDSYGAGFVAGNIGTVFQAFATGTVTDDGNTVLGGFAAFNAGSLDQVFATGKVTGGTSTLVGGLVAVNGALSCDCDTAPMGSITNSYATGGASGGANSVVGGLVAINDGTIQTTYSTGPVTGTTTGGLVAQNNPDFQFSNLGIPNIVAPAQLQSGSGTISNSYWNTQTSGQNSSDGGTGMTTQQLISGLPAGFDKTIWTILPDPSYPYFPWSPIIPTVDVGPSNPNAPPQQQINDNLTDSLVLVSLPPAVTVLPPPTPPPSPDLGGPPRLFAVPPAGETRYVMNEVLVMVDCDAPQSAIDAVARDLRLTVIDKQCLTVSHQMLLRLRINSGLTVADVINRMKRYNIVALAQANFIYKTMQDLAQDPNLAGHTQEGDAAQYALGKLGLTDIHKQIKGANISIAVIDSQIDIHHPDLEGVFADQYNAVGVEEKAHPHGTGMAGAIAAHRRLMGIAPDAKIYAIHAFSSGQASADSTTFNILKGIDWAVNKGVRVINMSFAGPRDPSMERALKAAHDKGIVLIAAAGNAGPKSPPLYPGADPNVIAVTATDVDDKIFAGANRGKYIAVAAPGVDILVPAPDNTYQLTTGTSVSSAEVAGIAALLLERNPNLTPDEIRQILTTSARHPGTKPRDDDFGSGLVDPSKAIEDAAGLKPPGQPAKR